LAITTALTLRAVFRWRYVRRRADRIRSSLLGLDLAAPDIRRSADGRRLAGVATTSAAKRSTCWSTAQVQALRSREWLAEKHAARAPRSWRKLHIGVDADTGQIIAAELTGRDVDDGSQVGPCWSRLRAVASFTGDGAYDRDDVYREVCQRHPDAEVIVRRV